MTAPTMAAPAQASQQVAFFTTDTFGPKHKKGHWYAKDDGTQAYRMERVAIFRSGEFRDSMGEQHTFDPMHMSLLSSNFSFLRSSGAFPDPPVRCNHPGLFSGGGLEEVMGYVDNMQTVEAVNEVDGQTYTYLLADFDILDQDAARKVESGLWRNRSAEIGWYTTNDGMEFWPVLVGFAYVDIPAVEGLNGNFSKYANALPGVGKTFVAVAENKEAGQVADENNKDGQQNGTSQHSAAPAAPAPVAPPVQAPAPFEFSIGDKKTHDFAAVQAYITSIESANAELQQFQTETVEAGRAAFVNGLATGERPKIFASQVGELQKLVKTMTDEQFGLFKASYEDAPGQQVLGQHAVADASFGTPPPPAPEDADVEQAKRTVARHKMSGAMTKEQIAQTKSGQLLASKGIDLDTIK